MNISEITDGLNLNSLADRKWYVQGASTISGDGLHEGLDWLSHQFDNVKLQFPTCSDNPDQTEINLPEIEEPILTNNKRSVLIGLDAAGLFN